MHKTHPFPLGTQVRVKQAIRINPSLEIPMGIVGRIVELHSDDAETAGVVQFEKPIPLLAEYDNTVLVHKPGTPYACQFGRFESFAKVQ